jgi:hypothetical protein
MVVITFVTSIPAYFILYAPVRDNPDYITGAGAGPTASGALGTCGVPEFGARPGAAAIRGARVTGHDRRRVTADAVPALPAGSRPGSVDEDFVSV